MKIIAVIAGIIIGAYTGSLHPTPIYREHVTGLPFNERGKESRGALDTTKIEMVWDLSHIK